MSWKKISIWLINILMLVSILGMVFSGIILFRLQGENAKGFSRVTSHELRLTDQNKYQIDESVQVKIINDELKHSKIKISHAQLLIANEDLNVNWGFLYVGLRLIFFLFALYLVREIISSADNPFIKPNVKRLKILGLLLISSGFIEKLESLIGMWYLKTNFEFVGLELESSASINWTIIIAGLFIMVIAQVFNHGIELKQEQELTI